MVLFSSMFFVFFFGGGGSGFIIELAVLANTVEL